MLAILLLAILAQSVHALEFGYEYGYYKVLTDSTVSLSTITVYRPTNFVVPEKVVDYSGKSYTVVEIGSGVAYLNEENLSGITIPGTVKRISDGAFSECGSLGNVYLSEGLESIGDNAFDFAIIFHI